MPKNFVSFAYRKTRYVFGFSRRSFWLSVLVAIVFVGLLAYLRGWSHAKIEAQDYLLYAAAIFSAAIVPTFLYYLWLAPYRILNERLECHLKEHPTVDQDARRRSELHMKQQEALRDMRTLQAALKLRQERSSQPSIYQVRIQALDHDYAVLKEKHSSWLPDSLTAEQMDCWVQRVMSVLQAHGYEDAKRIIEQAAAKGSWKVSTSG